MTTSTLDRLAESAVAARGGADLYRFALDSRIPDAAFAKNADGSTTIKGLDLLKTGRFNGLELIDEDLVAMAARFADLSDSGVFVPPFRLDHSWSVLSVVGYFEKLETYVREDPTDGLTRTFLRGDVRLTGSVDYQPAQLVDAIKRGALRSRSSELGYYVTNAGVEIPLAFYGCAFVDIPAVEGLAPVKLSRRPSPHSITNLSPDPEGSPRMTDETSTDETGEVEVEETPAGETAEETPAVEVEEAPEELEETPDEVEGETPAGETGEAPAGAPADEVHELRTSEETPEALENRRLREEIARLRRAETDRQIAGLRSSGVIVAANEEAAVGLLSHDDEDVRRMAGTLLGNVPAAVTLGSRRGRTSLSDEGHSGGNAGQVIRVGMSKDEVGPLWANLTREERIERQPEYDAWRLDREQNGIRD